MSQLIVDTQAVPQLSLPSAAYDVRNAMLFRSDLTDDLARDVYCILGMPIDAVDTDLAVAKIRAAARTARPYFVSTPNLNFVTNSQTDTEFRDTLLHSDLCPPDGMPIVWAARILGLPIRTRVAGADVFEMLKSDRQIANALNVFLFGGAEGVAVAAAKTLNENQAGLRCVGHLHPGYCTVEQASTETIIEAINLSGADILVVALGAVKGQVWLKRNHERLRISVRAHLGAVINFEAGIVKRAPLMLRKTGLEWLWRIKEEPYLWTRYARDAGVLLRLLFTRILPLATQARWQKFQAKFVTHDLLIEQFPAGEVIGVNLTGSATTANVAHAIARFREAAAMKKSVTLDMSGTKKVDARFLGLLLMLRKVVIGHGGRLNIVGVAPSIARAFRLHDLEFLISNNRNS